MRVKQEATADELRSFLLESLALPMTRAAAMVA
jgi:hypothetical protein